LLSDRDLSGKGIEVQMWGHGVRVAAGPAALALAAHAALIPVGVSYERLHGSRRRAAKSRWGTVLSFGTPLDPGDFTGDDKVASMSQAWATELADTVTRVEQLKMEFVELVLARRKVLAAMEPEIVHLAVDIAEKIVGMELATGRDIIAGIVRQGLATLKARDEIVVRVNPSEVEALKAHQSEYEAMIDGLKRFEIIADGAIEPGSCAIETNLGNVDARISTQLEAVRAGLDEMCKIRGFEMKDKLAAEPVEVPDDPEFHARIMAAEAEARAAEAAAKAEHH
jgi:hypothetical protein